MSVAPILTFKAGLCDLDVSSTCELFLVCTVLTRPSARRPLPESRLKPPPGTSTCTMKTNYCTCVGDPEMSRLKNLNLTFSSCPVTARSNPTSRQAQRIPRIPRSRPMAESMSSNSPPPRRDIYSGCSPRVNIRKAIQPGSVPEI
jgi:hypothetical protein